MHKLQQVSHEAKCDHPTQVKQTLNDIPMWICCDCGYFKIAIYEKNIFDSL